MNNAGGSLPRHLMATSERSFEMALRFNVTAAFLLTKLVVPPMIDAGGGAIVNISSRSASMVQPAFTAYATAKAALSMMTRAMAPELAPKIRVNAIEVGGVETDALAYVLSDDSVRAQLEGNTPMKRVGDPSDIAAAVVYLVSDASFMGDRQDLRDRRRRRGARLHGARSNRCKRRCTYAPRPASSGRSRYVLIPGSAPTTYGIAFTQCIAGRDQPDLGILADHRRVQPVEGARHRRLGVELDLEALLAELPRRVERVVAHQPVHAHGHDRLPFTVPCHVKRCAATVPFSITPTGVSMSRVATAISCCRALLGIELHPSSARDHVDRLHEAVAEHVDHRALGRGLGILARTA